MLMMFVSHSSHVHHVCPLMAQLGLFFCVFFYIETLDHAILSYLVLLNSQPPPYAREERDKNHFDFSGFEPGPLA